MKNRKYIYSILCALFVLAMIFAGMIFSIRKDILKIAFLDVGQGDSILISQGSNQVLIDGGKDGRLLLEKLGKYIPFWDRNIEIIVATHPDQDHIEGLINVLRSYRINSVLKTNAESDSETYKNLEKEITAEDAQKVEAKKGVTIKFPNGAIATVLFPVSSIPKTADNASNDHSVVVKLAYGGNSFLFTSDLPTDQEKALISDISASNSLNSKVLKVSHHGSKYATSSEFLDAVRPADSIISVGKSNSYGHPNQEVLERLLQHKIRILRTDEIGDIIYQCLNPENDCQMQNS